MATDRHHYGDDRLAFNMLFTNSASLLSELKGVFHSYSCQRWIDIFRFVIDRCEMCGFGVVCCMFWHHSGFQLWPNLSQQTALHICKSLCLLPVSMMSLFQPPWPPSLADSTLIRVLCSLELPLNLRERTGGKMKNPGWVSFVFAKWPCVRLVINMSRVVKGRLSGLHYSLC